MATNNKAMAQALAEAISKGLGGESNEILVINIASRVLDILDGDVATEDFQFRKSLLEMEIGLHLHHHGNK